MDTLWKSHRRNGGQIAARYYSSKQIRRKHVTLTRVDDSTVTVNGDQASVI
jgi:hypothetical protein